MAEVGNPGRGRAQRRRRQAEEEAELATPQHLPETPSAGRGHVLDSSCWCGPATTEVDGRPALVHQAEPEPPAPMVVRTPRRRSRWGRPWDSRR